MSDEDKLRLGAQQAALLQLQVCCIMHFGCSFVISTVKMLQTHLT